MIHRFNIMLGEENVALLILDKVLFLEGLPASPRDVRGEEFLEEDSSLNEVSRMMTFCGETFSEIELRVVSLCDCPGELIGELLSNGDSGRDIARGEDLGVFGGEYTRDCRDASLRITRG